MAKILIVEDEKQMADFINLELKHEGYEVDICYDGEQGYEKAIQNIFDRFYRIDKSRNKETDRVGLGLAIAKSIANVNGAEIKLESKQGKDSTFTIFFKESLVH